MLTEPIIERRNEQPYMAIRIRVEMDEISIACPPLIGEVLDWLMKKNSRPLGPAFFRYFSCEGNGLVMDIGTLVRDPLPGDGRVEPGSFPAGRYVKLAYYGDYRQLRSAHLSLEKWAEERQLHWEQTLSKRGVAWGARTEFYINSPNEGPDAAKWHTDLVFLLNDEAGA
jgi:effector-binding domain-containing protein